VTGHSPLERNDSMVFGLARSDMLSAELEFNPRLEDHLTSGPRRAKSNAETPGQAFTDLPISTWKKQVNLLTSREQVSGRPHIAVVFDAWGERAPSLPAKPAGWLKVPAIASARPVKRTLENDVSVHLESADVLLDNAPQFHLASVTVEEWAFKRELGHES